MAGTSLNPKGLIEAHTNAWNRPHELLKLAGVNQETAYSSQPCLGDTLCRCLSVLVVAANISFVFAFHDFSGAATKKRHIGIYPTARTLLLRWIARCRLE